MTLRLPEARVRELYERWRRGDAQRSVEESAVEDGRAASYDERIDGVLTTPPPTLTAKAE